MKIDFAVVEGGAFNMGSTASDIATYTKMFDYAFKEFTSEQVKSWLLKQVPPHRVVLNSFEMSRSLITRAQYGYFETAVFGRRSEFSMGDEDRPVEGVSFFQARQFCRWLSDMLATDVSLPTEAEWEYAASSRGRFLFPWGDEWDPKKANTAERGPGHATKAGEFAGGDSAQGIHDLAGNLEEWTDSFYLPYPGGVFVRDDICQDQGDAYPVLRGGSYRHHGDLCLASRRHGYRDNYAMTGFRVVRRDCGQVLPSK
jgi:toxoflavin biosynthesis protein ToxD